MSSSSSSSTTTSHHDVLLKKLERNDHLTPWVTLSRNHIGMDLCRLTSALKGNSHILKISCHAPFVANLSTLSLTRLLEAFAGMAQLEELWVALPNNRSHLSFSVVETLASGHMKKLSLRGVNQDACLAVAHTLLASASAVEELNLYGDCSTEACLEVIKALETNTTLQKLAMPRVVVTNSCCRALARILKVNNTLTKLDLMGSSSNASGSTPLANKKDNSKGCREIVQVLATGQNTTLESLQLDTSVELRTALGLYTQINRAKIPALLQQSNVSWTDFLAVVEHSKKDDVSLLYHVLLQAPQWLESGFGHSNATTGVQVLQQVTSRRRARRMSLPFLPQQQQSPLAPLSPVKKSMTWTSPPVAAVSRRCSEPITSIPMDDLEDLLCLEESAFVKPEQRDASPPKKMTMSPRKSFSPPRKSFTPPRDKRMSLPSPLTICEEACLLAAAVDDDNHNHDFNSTPRKRFSVVKAVPSTDAVPTAQEEEEDLFLPQWNEKKPICPQYKDGEVSSNSSKKDSHRVLHDAANTPALFAVPLTRQGKKSSTLACQKRSSKVWETAHVFGEPRALGAFN